MNSFFFHDGILAIRKPFHKFFFFHNGTLAIRKPFARTFLLHYGILAITEPFHDFFTWWNLGYHGAFSRIFLSHGGISAITEPFHEFFFHMVESRLSRSLFTNFSFTWWNSKKMHDVGEDSFHIYDKEYLHRIRLVKNLAS
jgi:hypothetical protein